MTKIQIKKVGKDSYIIKLDEAMVTFVSKKELLEICKEVQKDGRVGADFEIDWQDEQNWGNFDE